MKILFTSTGSEWNSLIDSRFGRAEHLVVFDTETNELTPHDNSAVKNEAHGAGTATAQKVFDLKPDVIITGNGPGETAFKILNLLELDIYVDAHNMTLEKSYKEFLNNQLTKL